MRNTFAKQHDATDCAAACLAMVCLHYKKETTITQLRDMMGTDLKGTNLVGLSKCADELGFVSQPVRVDRENFMTDFTLPCIANVITKEGMTHFVVVFKKIRSKKGDYYGNVFDGTLVMPANYAVVSEDEMTYVDGGGKHWYNSVDFVAGSIDVLLWMLPNLGAVNTALKNGGSLSTVLGAVGVGKDKLVGFAVNALKKAGIKKASQKTVERAIGLVWVYSRLTIGTLIAEGIDSADGCDDGYLFA